MNLIQSAGRDTSLEAKDSLKKVKVSYGASKYQSHSRVARAYRELIGAHCDTIKEIEKADIVVLHFEPQCLESLFQTYPVLKHKYVVGYFVWEANELPVAHRRGTTYVQEIWTCSQYCCDVFKRNHPRVKYMPHVVERDTSCSEADDQYVRALLPWHRDNFYFLTITKLWDLRKNTRALVEAFNRQRSNMPGARLILKAGPQDVAEGWSHDGIVILRENFNDAQMNALYRIADAYVSPHHSEGWGLTLSDAMIFQKPAIATGYSGNCEFMNPENSLLLDFTVSNIKPEDCFGYFDRNMKWAYPSLEDLEKELLFLYRMRGSPEVQQMTWNASRDIRKFSRPAVSRILKQHIGEIVNSQVFSKTVARG